MKLSKEEAGDMLADAARAAYRDMNRLDREIELRVAGKTPDENFAQLVLWLRVLAGYITDFAPDRTPPTTDVNLL
jgi:hypothetical protein